MNILTAENITKRFSLEAGLFARYGRFVKAVNGISLEIKQGETYGLVGESGCGKTTLARLLVRLYRTDSGKILFERRGGMKTDITGAGNKELKEIRSRIKYIFQDPAKSLNPRLTVRQCLLSGYRYSPNWPGRKKALEEAAAVMENVGLKREDLDRRPAEFSGGQRQRISIARALIQKPEVLICDEVVSALDVSIQSQILNLLLRLKKEYSLTMLFIAHDLTVTTFFCDRIGVMYRGLIMEEAPAPVLIENQLHPYTRLLYNAIPERMKKTDGASPGKSIVPSGDFTGCPFTARCPLKQDICDKKQPELREIEPGHKAACHFAG